MTIECAFLVLSASPGQVVRSTRAGVASAGVNGAGLHLSSSWTRKGSGSLRLKAESSVIHRSKVF